MSFFLISLKIRLKLLVNRYSILSLLVLLILFTSFNVFYSKSEKGLKVGFLNDSSLADKMISDYKFYNNTINIQTYSDKQVLINDVKKGVIDTGYVFPKQFIDTPQAINVYSSPKSMLMQFNNIFIDTLYIQPLAGKYGYEVINKNFSVPKDKTIHEINKSNSNYLLNAPFMTYDYLEENPNSPSSKLRGIGLLPFSASGGGVSNPIQPNEPDSSNNIIFSFAVLIIIIFMLLVSAFDKESMNKDFYNRLTKKTNKYFFYGNYFSYYIFVLMAISCFSVAINSNISTTLILTITLFSMLLTTFLFAIKSIIKNENNIIIFASVYFILSIIFGEIFINISQLANFLWFVKYFFITYYLNNFYLLAIVSVITTTILFIKKGVHS